MTAARTGGLDPCVHCGFCLQACPTYLATSDEADSPRGRIVLMQGLAAGHLTETDPAVRLHLDRCLGCRACEPACPSGVEYGHALEATRAALLRHRSPPIATRALHGVIAEPVLRRMFFGAARMLRPLSAWFAGASRVGTAWGMLAATSPFDHRSRVRAAESAGETPGPHPDRSPTVVVFRGCIMDDLFGHVHAATERVLRANGCTVIEAPPPRCCGALHMHAGQRDGALALAHSTLEAFDALPADAMLVVNAAGCGAMLKEYDQLFTEPADRDRASVFASRVRDVTEVLAVQGPRRGAALDLRVAYDPPCHLAHAQRILDAPEAVLSAVPGLTRLHHADAGQCCGSAGSYTFAQPEMSAAVLGAKVEALRATNPDIIVTGNPGCIMQIGAGMRAAGMDVPVVHPVELLDWAYERAGYYRG